MYTPGRRLSMSGGEPCALAHGRQIKASLVVISNKVQNALYIIDLGRHFVRSPCSVSGGDLYEQNTICTALGTHLIRLPYSVSGGDI